jgi:hypothetical protein
MLVAYEDRPRTTGEGTRDHCARYWRLGAAGDVGQPHVGVGQRTGRAINVRVRVQATGTGCNRGGFPVAL